MIEPLVGVSKQIVQIRHYIKCVADTGLNILITGETGVGKEVVARKLHQFSPRRSNPFVQVNCAALPENLLESELFGYIKGAFTGAQVNRRGKFQIAHKGVLFLDEIGDMPLSLQSKILHVLQGGRFFPLGAEKDVTSNAWVIAATNFDLEVQIALKKFREDLFYRLNIIKIHVPALRHRAEDIPLLITHFMNRYIKRFPNRNVLPPNAEVMSFLCDFHWPGNIRQLQNTIKKQCVINDWSQVITELIDSKIPEKALLDKNTLKNSKKINAPVISDSIQSIPFSPILLEILDGADINNEKISLKQIRKKVVQQVEKEIIAYVLDQTGWNRVKASKILKISYKTLLTKINELNLVPPSKQ
ncbi:regulatory protein, Fis family [Desulfocicer vacuolatum DSM 3385]|uniref:Regulatory protein, Fis family n=1 Tax=Desulfocicer vacuolatum DSM 3385 TaxID=1121400 RepID=A0A1W1ZN43_9BACT|nr:sigma-54 dependent transcriptional regulator [Desulfocicer vacuolatum]SMC49945.1 regulatory protein, Fis family [Desulfocicer vacuolatum DSM 3385]